MVIRLCQDDNLAIHIDGRTEIPRPEALLNDVQGTRHDRNAVSHCAKGECRLCYRCDLHTGATPAGLLG